MNPDKFLTDLAALTGCECVRIDFYGVEVPEQGRFEVTLWKKDFEAKAIWLDFHGTGPTVEAAMQDARAKLAAHYEGEPA